MCVFMVLKCVSLCRFLCVLAIDLFLLCTDNRHYAGTLGFSLSSHISSGKLASVCLSFVFETVYFWNLKTQVILLTVFVLR